MSENADHQFRGFVEHWRRVGPLLEGIRRQELRKFDFAANREIIDSLLDAGLERALPRRTSGLVGLERKLRELHERHLSGSRRDSDVP